MGSRLADHVSGCLPTSYEFALWLSSWAKQLVFEVWRQSYSAVSVPQPVALQVRDLIHLLCETGHAAIRCAKNQPGCKVGTRARELAHGSAHGIASHLIGRWDNNLID